MSSLSQFSGGGGITPKGLINGVSPTPPVINYGIGLNAATGIDQNSIKCVVSGAQSAGVLATVLNLSGQGAIEWFSCASVDVTSRTHRIKITLDSVVIYDATSPAVTSVNNWIIPVGSIAGITASSVTPSYEPILFSQSLLIQYASSLGETGKTVFGYRYIPR